MGKIKELGILIIQIVVGVTVVYLMFTGLNVFGDYLQDTEVIKSNFCEDLNMSFHMVVSNGFASSKIICLDNENNRQEYYYEEAFN